LNNGAQRAHELLESSGARFHALLARITLREDVADDLLQELFLKLSRTRKFASAVHPEAYAHQVAVRMAFDWRRSQRRHPTMPLADDKAADNSLPPFSILAAREELEAVLVAMGELSVQTQQVLTLRFLEGHSYEAIAAELGQSAHRSRSICHKGIVRLRRMVARGRAGLAGRRPRDV